MNAGLSNPAAAKHLSEAAGRAAGAERRPAARCWRVRPGATQIKKTPKNNGIKKAAKKVQGPPTINVKMLTAFFSTAAAPHGGKPVAWERDKKNT